MKFTFQIWQRNPDKFAVIAEDGTHLAESVSPELAAWIKAHASIKTNAEPCLCGAQSNCCDVADKIRGIRFGEALTEGAEVEI